MQYEARTKSRGFFNRLQSREREEPKIEPSNLDPIRKVISKETGSQEKEDRLDELTLRGIFS